MARRKSDSPQKAALREMMSTYLKEAVTFMDAIHYHVRSEGRIVKRAVYIAIGIDMSGRKNVCRRERKHYVLAFHYGRPEEPRSARNSDPLRRWSDRISAGD